MGVLDKQGALRRSLEVELVVIVLLNRTSINTIYNNEEQRRRTTGTGVSQRDLQMKGNLTGKKGSLKWVFRHRK